MVGAGVRYRHVQTGISVNQINTSKFMVLYSADIHTIEMYCILCVHTCYAPTRSCLTQTTTHPP